jgi:hypothetical protein
MSLTTKRLSRADDEQVLRGARVDEDLSIMVSGFLAGKVGRKIDAAISTTSVANDTITYSYSELSQPLYAYKVIFTDGTRSEFLSAERIS